MDTKKAIVSISNEVLRRQVAQTVAALPEVDVIAQVGDLMNTYNEVEANLPQAVLISSDLATLPEFEVMRGLFAALDVRWLVVENTNKFGVRGSADARFAGMSAGLFSVDADAGIESMGKSIRSLLHGSPSPAISKISERPNAHIDDEKRDVSVSRLILIGASTGGVDALTTVLSGFPADCPPTVIVQHTGAGFGVGLVSLLDRQCSATVKLASDGLALRRGEIFVGAGMRMHLLLSDSPELAITLKDGPPESGHLPSVDALFCSAKPFAHRVNAALLTGMGRDGAEGLKALRDAGARTIAQDEESSVVYGMPRAAVALGAAAEVLPLERVAEALMRDATSAARVAS